MADDYRRSVGNGGDHGFEIARVGVHRPVVGGRSLRLTVPTHVVHDDAELVREVPELIVPTRRVEAETVGEHDGGARAGLTDVQLRSVEGLDRSDRVPPARSVS